MSAGIGSLKRFRINRHGLAKKLLFPSGPVGPDGDIAPIGEFFAIL